MKKRKPLKRTSRKNRFAGRAPGEEKVVHNAPEREEEMEREEAATPWTEEEGTERDEGGNTSGRFSGENGRGSECSSGKGRGTRNASSEGTRGQGATLAGTLIWGGLFALASGAAWAGLFWLCFAGGSCR